MIDSRGIEKFSWRYFLLKNYVNLCFRYFYKVRHRGKEKVNLNDILVFAPNHQNALMDALALLSLYNFQPVFLARSDIFKNKFISKILTFLKILPVYRMRDGYGELQKNDATFIKTIEILKNKRGLGIFPEGSHGLKKQLRRLKKGIARITMQAMDASEKGLDIKIVPIGIYYQDHHKRGSGLFMQIGEPFSIKAFHEVYRENPAKAHNMLLENLGERLKKEMLHVQNDEAYDTIEVLIELYDSLGRQQGKKENEIFDKQKELIVSVENLYDSEPERYQELAYICREMENKLQVAGLQKQDAGLALNNPKWYRMFVKNLLLILGAPFYLFAVIQNFIPSLITARLKKLPKDPQFISSVNFVGGFVLYPLFYLIQSIIVLLITSSWKWAVIYLVSLPITMVYRDFWSDNFIRFRKTIRMKKYFKNLQDLINRIIQISGIQY
jgi:1-acyl-sn-glycerol-3-phosphate acyltransferase